MATDDMPDRGRESFGRHAWGDAYAQLSAADHEAPLGWNEGFPHLASVGRPRANGSASAGTDYGRFWTVLQRSGAVTIIARPSIS